MATVMIDAGHGGFDNGASYEGRKEKNDTLNLALAVGTWDHPLLDGCRPKDPYPIELVKQASWRTTADKAQTIRESGFAALEFRQTLTLSPLYSHTLVEDPMEGCDRGSYVAIIGYKI